MKKFVGILMTIIAVLIIFSNTSSLAEESESWVCECDHCVAMRKVEDFLTIDPYWDRYLNNEIIDDCHYYYGALDATDWQRQFNEEFSFDSWTAWAEKEFDMEKLEVEYIGNSGFYTVYLAKGYGINGNNIKYESTNKLEVVFVIYEET